MAEAELTNNLEQVKLQNGAADTNQDVVNPWNVTSDSDAGVDYDKLIRKQHYLLSAKGREFTKPIFVFIFITERFGSSKIDNAVLEKLEKVAGKPVHHLIRRGIFFSHRDLYTLLEKKEKGEPFYLYTGRGPSSDSMHIGHLIPFIVTK